jgi:hypothetical protein
MLCALAAVSLSLAPLDDHLLPFANVKGTGLLPCLYLFVQEERYLHRDCLPRATGRVTEVTEDTLTIRFRSGFCRTLEAAPALASKKIPLWTEVPWYAHRLNQVRVGDLVDCFLAQTPRGPVVVGLGIRRRPGGLIPPAEDEYLPEKMRTHNVFNKHQAEEIVEQFLATKLGRMLARFRH